MKHPYYKKWVFRSFSLSKNYLKEKGKYDMNVEPSKRLAHFQTGIFAALDAKKDARIKEGKRVYNLSVGTPDFPVFPHIQEASIMP